MFFSKSKHLIGKIMHTNLDNMMINNILKFGSHSIFLSDSGNYWIQKSREFSKNKEKHKKYTHFFETQQKGAVKPKLYPDKRIKIPEVVIFVLLLFFCECRIADRATLMCSILVYISLSQWLAEIRMTR